MPKPPQWYFDLTRFRRAAEYLHADFFDVLTAPTFLIDQAIMAENAERSASKHKPHSTSDTPDKNKPTA